MTTSMLDDNVYVLAVEAYSSVLQLLEAQTRVTMALNILKTQMVGREREARFSKVINSAESTRAHHQQMQTLANSLQDIVEPTARPSEASALVSRRVFAIPELMEHVLSYLEPAELLVAQRMNQSANLAVRSSFRLQRQLHLRCDRSRYFSTVFQKDNFPGLSVDVRKTQVNGVDWFWDQQTSSSSDESSRARLTIRFDGNTALLRAGKRCRSILVCQPALKSLNVQPTCCFADYIVAPAARLASTGGGVTVGDLFDAVETARKEHRSCALAEGPMHRTDGTVKVDVRVCEALELSPLDPIMACNRTPTQIRASRSSHRRSYSRQIEEQAKLLNDFAAAKRDALALGLRIPTLAEYQATLRQHEQLERPSEPSSVGVGGDDGGVISTTRL
nr:hypothetical protein CFP56_09890 [Quercus suber]